MKLPPIAARVLAISTALLPATAFASPWTLPQGTAVIGLGAEYQLATNETLQNSSEVRPYPLNGRFESQTLRLKARAGLTSNLEFEIQIPVKAVQYHSDLMFKKEEDGTAKLDGSGQQEVMNFNRHATGMADLLLYARHRLDDGKLPTALQLELKVPMGYDRPAGTLDEQGKVEDDVSLGDGQVDIAASVLLGYAFRTQTFLRFDAGFRLRLGGAGDEVLGTFKVGQMLPGNLLVFAEARGSYHVQDGRTMGITKVTIDPDQPPTMANIQDIDRPLHRDLVQAGAGALWRVTPVVEMQIGYVTPVWSRNLAVTHTVYVSMGVRADLTQPLE